MSSGLSEYFGDSEATVAEAVANENAAAVGGRDAPEHPLLSDVLTPPEVCSPKSRMRRVRYVVKTCVRRKMARV